MLTSYLSLIKFSHTIFALPFALIAVLIAAQGLPNMFDVFWVVVAMAGARSGAMGFNRWVDRKFDAQNPRTATRPSVTGEIAPNTILASVILSYGVLVLAASQLNILAFYLSPIAILLTSFYSLTKRFTAYSHLFLGLAIGAAPIAAWIAVTGHLSAEPLVLGLSVLCWIAGFDILYALQDLEVDRKIGLHSIPAHFGVETSIIISRVLHGITFLLWLILFQMLTLNAWFLVGVLICGALLLWEHRLVKPNDLSKLDMAFFNMNGYISVTMLVFTAISLI